MNKCVYQNVEFFFCLNQQRKAINFSGLNCFSQLLCEQSKLLFKAQRNTDLLNENTFIVVYAPWQK